MHVPMLKFVQHRAHGPIILRERLTHTGRQALIINELAQALAGQCEMPGTVLGRVSPAAVWLPGPSWQCGQHPLQYIH